MKLPIPPTGGQGGHYGGAARAPRLFDSSRPQAKPERVPRRFRGLRLRRTKRSRVMREHPLMTVLVLAVLAIPLLVIFLGLTEALHHLMSR